jgi:hypothetical protein
MTSAATTEDVARHDEHGGTATFDLRHTTPLDQPQRPEGAVEGCMRALQAGETLSVEMEVFGISMCRRGDRH